MPSLELKVLVKKNKNVEESGHFKGMGTLATLKCAYSEIVSQAPTWMNLEETGLGEMSQTQRDKYYVISFI